MGDVSPYVSLTSNFDGWGLFILESIFLGNKIVVGNKYQRLWCHEGTQSKRDLMFVKG